MSVDIALALLAVPHLIAGLYLAGLALFSRRRPPVAAPPATLRLVVVVPAHNEEGGIAATVRALASQDYPADLRRVVVVADNCLDRTQTWAEGAGAAVWVRTDPALRGKGYALTFAFERVLAEGWADAVVVLDADSRGSPQLLSALASVLAGGARAAQADYGVINADDSWRTRLLRLALALFHTTRSLGRERLGLSCGLRGNGMAFDVALLRQVPHDAYSLVEDLEYGLRLGQRGVRVSYVPQAQVWGEMPAGERSSRSQRRRWEQGRRQLARDRGVELVAEALRHRSGLQLDLALDLLVPPLSTLAIGGMLGLGCAVAVVARGGGSLALVAWGLATGSLAIYVGRGWQLAQTGARGLLDLATAPFYALWKLTLLLRRDPTPQGEWVRTARKTETRP